MRLEAFKLWALCLFIALAAAAPTPVSTGVEEKKPGKGQHTPGDHKENHKKGESLCYHAVLLLLTCVQDPSVSGVASGGTRTSARPGTTTRARFASARVLDEAVGIVLAEIRLWCVCGGSCVVCCAWLLGALEG